MEPGEQRYDIGLIAPQAVDALLAYLDYFESNEEFGEWVEQQGNLPWACLSERSTAFFDDCYAHHFVQPFDWWTWSEHHAELVHRGVGIEDLDLQGIGQLLTTHIRGDRFAEGHLFSTMRNGEIGRILRRLKELRKIGLAR